MTMLSIVQAAADELNETRPTSVAGNGDPDAQKFLRLLNRCGIGLMKAAPWQVLRNEKTFTAVGQEEQTNIIPDDFDRFVPETFWNRTTIQLVTGPMASAWWQAAKAQGYADTSSPRFIYRGGSVFMLPAPTAGDTLAFEYISDEWCQATGGGATKTAFSADTDVGLLDEEMLTRGLKAIWLATESMPNAKEAMEDFEDYTNTLLSNDQPDAGILSAGDIFGGGRHFDGTPPASGSSSII